MKELNLDQVSALYHKKKTRDKKAITQRIVTNNKPDETSEKSRKGCLFGLLKRVEFLGVYLE